MEQVNESQYEEMTMKADEAEKFNKVMEEIDEDLYKATGIKQEMQGAIDKAVNQPSHYDLWPDTTVIEVAKKTLSWEEFIGALKFNSLKYRLRAGAKKKALTSQDIAKAEWYEEELRKIWKDNQPR